MSKLVLSTTGFDRSGTLSGEEREVIDYAVAHAGLYSARTHPLGFERLLSPLLAALDFAGIPGAEHYYAVRVLLNEMHRRQTSYWAWSPDDWWETIGQTREAFCQRHGTVGPKARQHVLVVAYWLVGFDGFLHESASDLVLARAAANVFGSRSLEAAIQRLAPILEVHGYSRRHVVACLRQTLARLFLLNHSPMVEDLTMDLLEREQARAEAGAVAEGIVLVSQAMTELRLLPRALSWRRARLSWAERIRALDLAPEWAEWCLAWCHRSPLTDRTKETCLHYLGKVGVWLRVTHPHITSPEQWDDHLALEFVTALAAMKVGDFVGKKSPEQVVGWGKALSPRSKDHILFVLRRFFLDLQEVPHQVGVAPPRRLSRHFNPLRLFQTPASLRRLIGPDPRVIDDAWWWKLLHAAIELTQADLPTTSGDGLRYPLALVRAVAVTWCFSALRSDEIRRLRVGCIRWHWDEEMQPVGGAAPPAEATCFLQVPVNKTWTSFWKPVYALVGRCIEEWQALRPPQPKQLDQKTNELVDFLFAYRGRRIGPKYLNDFLLPYLCRKAGVPPADARGAITSHRARATIATMYYNCPEGLSSAEVQEFLGHADFRSTRSYLKVSPTKLARAVARANKNSRLVKVLIDPAAAVQGEPAIFYDLGDGTLCGNPSWAACPHRMACIKCPMHVGVELTQLIRAREGILHLLQEVPDLSEEERAAAEGDQAMLERLIQKYRNMPPPPVPNEQYRFNGHSSQRAVGKPLPVLQKKA